MSSPGWGGAHSLSLADAAKLGKVSPGELDMWVTHGKVLAKEGRIPVTEMPAIYALRDGDLLCSTCRNTGRTIAHTDCRDCSYGLRKELRLLWDTCEDCLRYSQVSKGKYQQCLACRTKNGAEQIKKAFANSTAQDPRFQA